MRDLKNKIAVVTGGSSGIGKAICKVLADEGCQVVNISRRREPKEGGVPVDMLPNIKTELCDVTDVRKLQKIIEKYNLSGIDILINNVGMLPLKNFLEQTKDDYNKIMNTNFMSAVFATQAALKIMLKRDGGSIVNIASTSGLKADPDTPIYGASKAALINFTESIAGQYGDKIQCNCICPGFIDTCLVTEGPGIPESEVKKVPMGRIGKPEEIAEVVIWVLKSTYMNGAVITVDGGRCHGVWRWGV